MTHEATQRPVRIAVLGDSFIEGDIMVGDLRSGLQRQYGGCGVGFVPVHSVAAQYRPTVSEEAEGWETWSILNDHQKAYTLPGMLFNGVEEEASIHAKMSDRYPELQEASTLKVIYAQIQRQRGSCLCQRREPAKSKQNHMGNCTADTQKKARPNSRNRGFTPQKYQRMYMP